MALLDNESNVIYFSHIQKNPNRSVDVYIEFSKVNNDGFTIRLQALIFIVHINIYKILHNDYIEKIIVKYVDRKICYIRSMFYDRIQSITTYSNCNSNCSNTT